MSLKGAKMLSLSDKHQQMEREAEEALRVKSKVDSAKPEQKLETKKLGKKK